MQSPWIPAAAVAQAGAAMIALALAGAPASAEAATCSGNPPCITNVTERRVGEKLYLNVHYRGVCKLAVRLLCSA
jgi:hypothetical protein